MSADPSAAADRDVEAVFAHAIAARLAPGMAAAVVTRGGLRRRWCRGTLSYDPGSVAIDEDTVFDLASVTKLLVTTRLLALAVDQGVIRLDECPWPAWPGVTVAHALRHDGGLVAHRPFFERAREQGTAGCPAGHRAVVAAVLATPPDSPPGTKIVYSDLGFIALGELLADRRARPLEAQVVDVVPAGSGLRFVHLADDGYHPALPFVAPTERCPWRRRIVQGQVHDDNAYAMGGVAGHAGLFGSIVDVEAAALTLLDDVQGTGTLAAWARVPGLRGLGFDKATPGGSTGDVLGHNTVGHLGFTGTSVWLDPDLDGGAVFVLLSNTVHPDRADVVARSRTLRRAFHVAAEALVRAAARAAASAGGPDGPGSG